MSTRMPTLGLHCDTLVFVEFALQTGGSWADVRAAAAWAEACNMAAFAVPDHYILTMSDDERLDAPDALAMLAALARETQQIELVSLVSPITFRHPAVLAKMAATIDLLSDGRFHLGVGTGWMDREHEVFGLPYPERAERFEMLEEALAYLRAALADTPTGFEGKHYSLKPYAIDPAPVGKLRLVVGGVGAHKTPRLAGTYADEYNVYPGGDMADRIARARSAAVEAGRDPDELMISSAGAVLVAPTESEYRELLASRAADAGIEVEQLEAHFQQRNTPRGSAEQVQTILADMADVGVTRFYLQAGGNFGSDSVRRTLGLMGA